MKKSYLTEGGEFITYGAYHTIILHSKVKQRALKIKNIIDARNKK